MNGADDAGRSDVVAAARRWIGTPYRHQASARGIGCDCLGLVRGVWREIVGPEPESHGPYSPDWAEAGKIDRLAEAGARHFHVRNDRLFRAGDVLLFRWREGFPAKHLGIATATDAMVHAHDGCAVCEVRISGWWRRRIVSAFSFPDP